MHSLELPYQLVIVRSLQQSEENLVRLKLPAKKISSLIKAVWVGKESSVVIIGLPRGACIGLGPMSAVTGLEEPSQMRCCVCRKPGNLDQVQPPLPPCMHLRVDGEETDLPNL